MMSERAAYRDLVTLPVAEVMSCPVFSVPADALLGDALAVMLQTGRRHLAVVDAGFRCLGVIGDRAVAAAWAIDPTALAHTRVRRILDPRPSVVGSDAAVRDVARVMHLDAVDAVAVIDRTGCPVGIVTGGDLVALMATHVESASGSAGEPADAEAPVLAEIAERSARPVD
jgi:CBS domain-containing protein